MPACLGKLNEFHSVLLGLAVLICHSLVFSQKIVITELFRNPLGAETALCGGASHEFIEIVNIGTDTFFTKGLFISDGSEADSIIALSSAPPNHDSCITRQNYIAPGQIALILDSDYQQAVEKEACALPIKNGTVLFKCADAELGNGLSDDDGVLLYKGSKGHIDSVIYILSDGPLESLSPTHSKLIFSDPKNIEGYSIIAKKLLVGEPSFDISSSGLTPGWLEQEQNGWIVESQFEPFSPGIEEVGCVISGVNLFRNSQKGISWRVEKNGLEIHSGELDLVDNRFSLPLVLTIDTTDYQFIVDNTHWLLGLSSVLLPQSPIKINEIYPFATQNESEWIELVNTSSMTINLKNWMICNNEDTALISHNELILNPGKFVVIAKNKKLLLQSYPGVEPVSQPSAWLTLNNFGDTLYILDSKGVIRDMVCYKSGWFDNSAKSIERVSTANGGCDSSNWALCKQNGSPGYPNSVIFWRNTPVTQMEIGPVPFTPNHDGKNDLLSINIIVSGAQSINLRIYSFNGRVVRQFNGPLLNQYFWDGNNDNGKAVANGPFFVVAEVKTKSGVKYLRKKGILWR